MSVREYIGARYVPVFADPTTWDSTKTYEPLTIVLYQGNSYTSKQYVPAGIDISNSNYWAQTGNYNSQVEAYRQEVLTFDQRISDNTQAIADEATARQQAVGNEATARQQADTTLGNRITALESKKVLIIGDSWSDVNWTQSTFNIDCWCKNLGTYLNLGVENRAVTSAGFTIGANNTKFIDQLNAATTTANELEYCIVIGGVNDIIQNPTGDFYAAVSAFINAFKTKYPNKMLYYFGINGSIRPNSQNNSLHFNSMTSGKSIRYWFAGNGFKVINLQNALYGYTMSAYQADNLHPSEFGHTILRRFILSHLSGNGEDFKRSGSIVFTPSSGVTIVEQNNYIYNNRLHIYMTLSADLSYGNNNIGTLALPLLLDGNLMSFTCENTAVNTYIRRIGINPQQNGTNLLYLVFTKQDGVTGGQFTIYGSFEIE